MTRDAKKKNGTQNQEKNQSVETNLEMTEMTEVTDGDLKTVDRNISKI